MNNRRRKNIGRGGRGYAAMAMVAFLGMMALATLIFVFRQGMHSHEAQVRNQVKIDYRQKEDALLRALVVELPNAAVGAMMDDSLNSGDTHKWEQVIARAITMANAETAVSSATLAGMGISGHITANTGDYNIGDSDNLVEAIVGDGSLVGSRQCPECGFAGRRLGREQVAAPPGLRRLLCG